MRNIILLTLLLLLPFVTLAGAISQKEEYEPKGPAETAAFEKALRKSLGVYVKVIWPRDEILAKAIRGKQLPNNAVRKSQMWLNRIVKKEFLPEKMDPNQWYGIKKLHFNQDYILGQFYKSERDVTLQFQTNGGGLSITAISKNYFPNDVGGISDAEIVKAITGLVNFPKDQIKTIKIEKKIEAMGDEDKKVLVCHGKLRAGGYDEKKGPYPYNSGEKRLFRTWWNYMHFLISKDRIFIYTTIINWETSPSTSAPYIFKLDSPK